MNLELLDPFRKQIPDRVDATLSMPAYFHNKTATSPTDPSASSTTTSASKQQPLDDDDDDWKAAYHVAYNRRGRFMAVGYGSGLVGVYDCISRNLAATYHLDATTPTHVGDSHITPKKQKETPHIFGVTSLSWSRRSRTLLAGAMGDSLVRLYDTTHPHGPEECTTNLVAAGDHFLNSNNNANKDDDDDEKTASTTKPSLSGSHHGTNPRASPSNPFALLGSGDRPSVRRSSFSNLEFHRNNSTLAVPMDTTSSSPYFPQSSTHTPLQQDYSNNQYYAKEPRVLATESDHYSPIDPNTTNNNNNNPPPDATKYYPGIFFRLPQPVGGSLEINPRHVTGGLAVLADGSLILFWVPLSALWQDGTPKVRLAKLDTKQNTITCASFDPQGQRVYASTKQGALLGFHVERLFQQLMAPTLPSTSLKPLPPKFTIRIPGGAAVWHLLLSRNGQYIVLNCADGALRLYTTKECWEQQQQQQQQQEESSLEEGIKPTQVFSDLINKQVKFASCALSGDGEYIVGGANEVRDDRYELYVWTTATGGLEEKLTGAAVQLYSVAWHPTRSLLSVATSDGLVDVWAPKVNWTAFAPDFQALPMNVEYVEREDEFDLDEHGNKFPQDKNGDPSVVHDDDESAVVDVVTIEPVPVFASDSEDEQDVFYFETKFANTIGNRGRHANVDA
ncbi:Retinoblastoma-binding protein 5 [Seminavis robusta]|uniref:Retinoblastoma-binding protein 5 n=1 Tax=Seminavis robusta TaxID=568900 RepID=A0A9N8HIQ2_9STRA|nr:Retinoblastoma-binding protein 5 [Seminavis robusta]|eukprot:Sro801_g204410.1 Retinoblastoma-binding protein 5 (675) ;mRNA; r:6022-8046